MAGEYVHMATDARQVRHLIYRHLDDPLDETLKKAAQEMMAKATASNPDSERAGERQANQRVPYQQRSGVLA